jgi:antitoxin component of MazEF toxin-antitoxin module
MIRKIIRIGNSYGVTLDKKMLNSLGMEGSTWVWVEPSKNKKEIIIRKKQESDW